MCASVQYVFVGLCMCAFTSGGVFSMSYTNNSSGAGVFNFSDVFFLSFHPEKGTKGFLSDVFFSCQVNIPVDLS